MFSFYVIDIGYESKRVITAHNSTSFCCVGNRLNLFFNATRCFENLSSGENLAGCADCVGVPSGAVFCVASSSFTSSVSRCASASTSKRVRLVDRAR